MSIESELNRAGEDFRAAGDRVPIPGVAITERHARMPVAVVGAAVLVLIIVGGALLARSRSDTRDVARSTESPVATLTSTPRGLPPTTASVPVVTTSTLVAYTIDAPGWRIGGVFEDGSNPPNRFVGLLDDFAGPASREGVLPGLSIWTGGSAESTLHEVESGALVPEGSFPLLGSEVFIISTGIDSANLLWTDPTGRAVLISYDRLDHDTARQVVTTLRPLTDSEWTDLLVPGPEVDTPHTEPFLSATEAAQLPTTILRQIEIDDLTWRVTEFGSPEGRCLEVSARGESGLLGADRICGLWGDPSSEAVDFHQFEFTLDSGTYTVFTGRTGEAVAAVRIHLDPLITDNPVNQVWLVISSDEFPDSALVESLDTNGNVLEGEEIPLDQQGHD